LILFKVLFISGNLIINISINKKPHLEMGFNKLGPNKPIFQEGPFLKLVI